MSKILVKKKKLETLPALTRHQNKIERFKLEEIVVDAYVNKNCTVAQVVKRCQADLTKRGVTVKINKTNVRNYIKKIRNKLAKLDQDFFQEVIQDAGVVDKIKNLSALVKSGWHRRQAIVEDMEACFEKGDRDGFQKAVRLDQQNDALMADIVTKLATLESKLQTTVTIEFVASLAQKMTDVVLGYDDIDALAKEHLVVKMSKMIDFGG